MSPRQIGMIASVSICVLFVACEDDVTQETTSTSPTTTTTTTGGGGAGAGGTDDPMGGAGGDGGIGGAGGDGGQACIPPSVDGNIAFFCGGTATTNATGGNQCTYCTQDTGNHEFTVDCTGNNCECKYDDTVICQCIKLQSEGCTNSCCPSPWGDTPIGTGGFGGAGGFGGNGSTGTTSGGGN